MTYHLFHEHPRCPAEKDLGVLGAGEVHSSNEDQVGQQVRQWPSDSHDQWFLAIDGKHSQGADSRPSNGVAQSDKKQAKYNARRWPFPEGVQIRTVGNGILHIGSPGNSFQDELHHLTFILCPFGFFARAKKSVENWFLFRYINRL